MGLFFSMHEMDRFFSREKLNYRTLFVCLCFVGLCSTISFAVTDFVSKMQLFLVNCELFCKICEMFCIFSLVFLCYFFFLRLGLFILCRIEGRK